MTAQREIEIEKVFESFAMDTAHSPFRAACGWLRETGYSYGSTDALNPTVVGVMRGKWRIAKWRNMTPDERASLDGLMTGDFRNGPVKVVIFKSQN